MAHSFRSPSQGAMVMECAGSMAFPENQRVGESSEAADSGTASHELAARCLKKGTQAYQYLGEMIEVKDDDGNVQGSYEVDDERATRVQSYVDAVRRDALGGILWVEHRVDLSIYYGEDEHGGTSDTVIIQPRKHLLQIKDLKDGQEKVWASYEHTLPDGTTIRRINHQMGQYALGALADTALAGFEIDTVEVEIQQPRVGHVDRFELSADELINEFGTRLVEAIKRSDQALTLPYATLVADGWFTPGRKQCRWCRAVARCPAYKAQLMQELQMDLDDPESLPLVPSGTPELAIAYRALPMVKQWVKAVESGTWNAVLQGEDVIGADGQPMKIVQGAEGKRQWKPDALLSGDIETMLTGQLGADAYKPAQPLTAPEAEKAINKKFGGKKKAAATWELFQAVIQKARGAAQLVQGSDPRPKWGEASAVASDFDDEIGVDE